MDAIGSVNNTLYQPCTDAQATNRSEFLTSAAAARKQTLDFTITTAEGDRVTLNSSVTATTAYASYQGDVTAQAYSTSRTSEMTLSIEGDLSKDELKDISKALHAYGKVLKDTLAGRSRPAEVHARQLGKLDELASFEGSFTMQESVAAQFVSVSA